MRILNLYADDEGESHFREIEIECAEETPWGFKVSKQSAAAIIFVEAVGATVLPSLAQSHPAPWRQYVINLDAGLEVTTSDGDIRVLGAGEVVLVEDTSGKGHVTKLIGEKVHRAIFVPIN